MSKSGLFAHFGSKEDLQVATIEAARSIFIAEVIKPAFEAPPGILRLWKLCDTWLSYVESGVFRGGCFFAAAASEFDGRPGVVRDRIADIMKEWLALLRDAVKNAQDAAQLRKDIDPTQLAFEFNSLDLGANWDLIPKDRASVHSRSPGNSGTFTQSRHQSRGHVIEERQGGPSFPHSIGGLLCKPVPTLCRPRLLFG